jgi:hypothetical protein
VILTPQENAELNATLDEPCKKIAEELKHTTSDVVMQQVGMSRLLNSIAVKLQSDAIDLDNAAAPKPRAARAR